MGIMHCRHSVIVILSVLLSLQLWSQGNESIKIIERPKDSVIEIRNGLLGIVIPNKTSFNSKNPKYTLAPIQSIIYRDGTYSDDTPNYLESLAAPTGMTVDLKNNTNECIVKIRYSFNKPRFVQYGETYKGGDAGLGYYQATIRVKKGSKSIMIEEDSDYDIAYRLKISKGLMPDKARYRGWSSLAAVHGYEPNGVAYQNEDKRAPLDAMVDVEYVNERLFPMLSLWDPAGGEVNTGRYWQVYNSTAPANSNLLGFFQGRASRMIGGRSVGPQLLARPTDPTYKTTAAQQDSKSAFLQLILDRRGPDNVWYPRKRFEWVLFISTKTDLLPADKFQPIGKEMNMVSGLGARIDEYAKKKTVIVPAFFDGSIYMPANKMQDLIKRLKEDESFYKMLAKVDPYFKPVTDAWRNSATANEMIKTILNFGEQLQENYKNGDGTHEFSTKYWKGSYTFKKMALNISCLFADKSIVIPAAKKEQLIQLVGLMARIQWDDDNVPFFDSAGINFGTPNMTHMYQNNGRNFFAMLLAKDPEFSKRASNIAKATDKELLGLIYPNGSTFGSPHYTQASIDPLLFTALQLKQAGVNNIFVEQKPLLKKFIDFYCSLLTPASVRFNNYRKLISFGDGSEESAVTFGLLASGYQDSDPALSAKLYSIFQNGAPRMSLFGDIAFTLDMSKNYSSTLQLSSSNFTGYLSHFRNAANSNNETALWIINGESYFDHRNNDRGEVAIYALKTPLSLSRSSFYYPRADDERIRSVVIPEAEFPEWKTANQPVSSVSGKGPVWYKSGQLAYAKLGFSNVSYSKMDTKEKEWYRRVVTINLLDEQPVILFYDSVNNNKPNIWSMLFMSEGTINTTAGDVKPDDRTFDYRINQQDLPKATAEKNLPKGLNKFSFTGQKWPASLQKSGGINWDLYTINTGSASFTSSQWTNIWQNSQEADEFLSTMGRPYSEMQQILRVKSNTPFFHVILPYQKGTEPYKNNVQLKDNNKMLIKYNKGELLISSNCYLFEGSDRTIVSTFTDASFRDKGFAIAGGITEILVAGNDVKIKVHGNSGKRIITVPFEMNLTGQNEQVKSLSKPGSTQVTIDYKSKGLDLVSTEQGYTEYSFRKK